MANPRRPMPVYTQKGDQYPFELAMPDTIPIGHVFELGPVRIRRDDYRLIALDPVPLSWMTNDENDHDR